MRERVARNDVGVSWLNSCAVVCCCAVASLACVTSEGLQKLEEEKTGLEKYLDDVREQSAELQAWLDAHPETEINPDTIVSALRLVPLASERDALSSCARVHGMAQVQPADVLSEQLLEETARDEAITDTLFVLGRAFQDMAADSDQAAQEAGLSSYLREVKRLSMQQFKSKALQQKIKQRRADLGL